MNDHKPKVTITMVTNRYKTLEFGTRRQSVACDCPMANLPPMNLPPLELQGFHRCMLTDAERAIIEGGSAR